MYCPFTKSEFRQEEHIYSQSVRQVYDDAMSKCDAKRYYCIKCLDGAHDNFSLALKSPTIKALGKL